MKKLIMKGLVPIHIGLFLGLRLTALAGDTSALSASIGPYLENSQVVGYQLTKIQPDSEWEKDGLRSDDIVVTVNGSPAKDFATTIDFVSALQMPQHTSLEILRHGKRQRISFEKKIRGTQDTSLRQFRASFLKKITKEKRLSE